MIATTATKVVYQGNGVTTSFPITFGYEDADNIKIKIYTIETDSYETLTSDYYVDVAQNVVLYPGYPPGEEPAEEDRPPILPATQKLVVYRDTAITQLRDLGAKYPLTILEMMFDHITQALQEQAERTDRCVQVGMAASVTPAQMLDSIAASVVNAANSASAASQSATSAGQSAAAAGTAEANAASSASAAGQSATAAETAKTSAANSASAAGLSATAAETAKTSAANSASAAGLSATAAETAKADAASSASAAGLSATAAENAKTSAAESATSASNSKTAAEHIAENFGAYACAKLPVHFERDVPFSAGEDSHTAIVSPEYMTLNINDAGYVLTEAVTLDVAQTDAWDTTEGTDYTVASNRAGRDFYIYACAPESGYIPTLILSANSTVPDGYTSQTSRKVGGFHCLCVDAGTNISDNNNVHPLSGYLAGDILPASVWDLKHRPKSEPEGMVYDEGLDLWIDIYLTSWTGAFGADSDADTLRLETIYGAATADGTSSEKFHCLKFEQIFGRQKKRLLYRREFLAASIGSNQGTAIAGAADVTTTGGHKDSAGRRMISNTGLEDCCGFLWQWGCDVGSAANSNWGNSYDANDRYVKGSVYGPNTEYRVLLGGYWANSSYCGSRAALWAHVALPLFAFIGARGASEPLGA